ncbi:MAG: uroporphyrinogen decarboxylase family protein [Armatimonadota bacterium]|nr:methyltransferase [bacterium]
MAENNSIYRERFNLTLQHKPVDRCPIDLGGTPQSTMDSWDSVKLLAEYLGFNGVMPDDYDKFDRRILEHWDIDFRRVGVLIPFKTKYNQEVSDTESIDEYGIRRAFTGLYYDIVASPLQNATRDDIIAYEFPTLDQMLPVLDDCEARAKKLYEESPYVIVGEHPVLGVLELACWLCGYDTLMMMLALDPDTVHLLFSKILEFQKRTLRAYYEKIGRYIHLTTSGDDFGTQKSLFMSPGMWREFVKPYMAERIAYTAKFTDAVYMHHSCGAIYDIIPDLAEIGVRILNPIQPAAEGMAPERLKSNYGDKITFHGGLDTQDVLPAGDPVEIEGAVEHLLGVMHPWKDGGYIFASAHNLQVDVSSKSIALMYDSVAKKAGSLNR